MCICIHYAKNKKTKKSLHIVDAYRTLKQGAERKRGHVVINYRSQNGGRLNGTMGLTAGDVSEGAVH